MKWRNDKKILLIILIIVIDTFLLFGQIIPTFDRVPYYQNQINELEQEDKKYQMQLIHLQYYEKRYLETEKKFSSLKTSISNNTDTTYLQTLFNQLRKSHHVRVVSEHVKNDLSNNFFNILRIQQQLEGSYEGLINYVKDFQNKDNLAVISVFSFINKTPLKKDPIIQLSLEINYYIPNLK